jgi:uncharacterized membrane protein
MEHLSELVHLVARWVHLIAGIMWIGNSMLFNWLDRNLVLPPDPKKGLVGEIWMVHSGGFYQVEKKFLAPSQMPKTLHWFKWQNGITWLSGIALLIVVYYMGGAAWMVDSQVASISTGAAIGIGVGVLVGAYVLYDLVWRSPLGKRPVLGFFLSVAIVVAGSAVLFTFLSGRAAYIHVGVMLGTLMTGNVWFVILPSQRELIAATNEGREQDPAIGYQAKQRSIHNNYMTFPLLFIMLSGHFPSTFGHAWNWVVLVVLVVGSAAIRHFMNIRYAQRRWLLPATLTFFAACAATLFLFAHPRGLRASQAAAQASARTVGFPEAHAIIQKRCTTCHSEKPTTPGFAVAPKGIVFDTAEQIRGQAAQIKKLACELRTMPLANLTQMTDDERALLAAWIDQGARLD